MFVSINFIFRRSIFSGKCLNRSQISMSKIDTVDNFSNISANCGSEPVTTIADIVPLDSTAQITSVSNTGTTMKMEDAKDAWKKVNIHNNGICKLGDVNISDLFDYIEREEAPHATLNNDIGDNIQHDFMDVDFNRFGGNNERMDFVPEPGPPEPGTMLPDTPIDSLLSSTMVTNFGYHRTTCLTIQRCCYPRGLGSF